MSTFSGLDRFLKITINPKMLPGLAEGPHDGPQVPQRLLRTGPSRRAPARSPYPVGCWYNPQPRLGAGHPDRLERRRC